MKEVDSMRILVYIVEYLAVGVVLSLEWNEMRRVRGKEKNTTYYTILDILLWPVAIVARVFGYVQGFIEGFFNATKGS